MAIARTNAAKPAADEASPAAVGKLFADTSRRVSLESFGRDPSFASTCSRKDRRRFRHACVRFDDSMSSFSPLRMSESGPEKDSEHEAVVCVRRDFCESVTDSDEFVGKFRATSRLPQYLSLPLVYVRCCEIEDCAVAYLLNHSDVDGSSGACTVYLRRSRHNDDFCFFGRLKSVLVLEASGSRCGVSLPRSMHMKLESIVGENAGKRKIRSLARSAAAPFLYHNILHCTARPNTNTPYLPFSSPRLIWAGGKQTPFLSLLNHDQRPPLHPRPHLIRYRHNHQHPPPPQHHHVQSTLRHGQYGYSRHKQKRTLKPSPNFRRRILLFLLIHHNPNPIHNLSLQYTAPPRNAPPTASLNPPPLSLPSTPHVLFLTIEPSPPSLVLYHPPRPPLPHRPQTMNPKQAPTTPETGSTRPSLNSSTPSCANRHSPPQIPQTSSPRYRISSLSTTPSTNAPGR